jgi:hypothetical protein
VIKGKNGKDRYIRNLFVMVLGYIFILWLINCNPNQMSQFIIYLSDIVLIGSIGALLFLGVAGYFSSDFIINERYFVFARLPPYYLFIKKNWRCLVEYEQIRDIEFGMFQTDFFIKNSTIRYRIDSRYLDDYHAAMTILRTELAKRGIQFFPPMT